MSEQAPKRRRSRFRFGLRTLFVVVTVLAMVAGWLAWNVQRVNQRELRLRVLRDQGGYALPIEDWDDGAPREPEKPLPVV